MFIDNFTNLCHRVHKSPTKVCKELGLSNATYSYWRNHKNTPRRNVLKQISSYFNVPMEDLVSDNLDVDHVTCSSDIKRQNNVVSYSLSEDEVTVLLLYKKAPESLRNAIKTILTDSILSRLNT